MYRAVSPEGNAISVVHQRLLNVIHERRHSDTLVPDDLSMMFSSILSAIMRIDERFSIHSVRVSDDRNLRSPRVDERSMIREVLRRLGNQVAAACRLADMVHAGPRANNEERTALDVIQFELEDLYAGISPLSSAAESE